MLLVHFELYVQLDERRAGSVLEVNGAGFDDFDRLEWSGLNQWTQDGARLIGFLD